MKYFLSTILVLTVFALAVFGKTDKTGRINDFLKPFVEKGYFAGQVLASENGKVIYEKAFGLANADFKVSNQLNTRIGIASVTKPMTKVILLSLIENKQISLTDNLSKYIPDFPNGDKITIEMLFLHRSGIKHRVMSSEMESLPYTSAEFIEKVKQSPLAFDPGTQNLYSSAGYAVLARCLEIASGKSYSQLLREYVFTPAGMTDSVNFEGNSVMERRSQDYFYSPDGLINVPLKNYSFLVGAGSVYSTAKDIHRFGDAVLDNKYGKAVKTNLVNETSFVADGSTNGHRAYLKIEKNKKYGFVVLSNISGVFDVITQGIEEILAGKEPKALNFTVPKVISNPNKDLNEFAGKYKQDGGSELNINLKNDVLYADDTKLYPVKKDCFFEFQFFGEACFNRNDSGKIKEIRWKSFVFEFAWARQ